MGMKLMDEGSRLKSQLVVVAVSEVPAAMFATIGDVVRVTVEVLADLITLKRVIVTETAGITVVIEEVAIETTTIGAIETAADAIAIATGTSTGVTGIVEAVIVIAEVVTEIVKEIAIDLETVVNPF
jgi:hypothetical protein